MSNQKRQYDNAKILLVYPEYPDTFWSFRHALKFISKKAVHPPLGLLTVAAMLPGKWPKRLVDTNTTTLKDRDLDWADYVFIGAMAVQRASAEKIIQRCLAKGKTIVAGGPLFTSAYEDFPQINHFILDEAEFTLPPFLEDIKKGVPQKIYSNNNHPELHHTPIPLWELIETKRYATMDIQYSRGCPYNCDFCDITTLFGHKSRTKNKWQMIMELERLYELGWRGNVFFVDDNFIGNKRRLKQEVLPLLIDWMERKKHPFTFSTEASIDLADDNELIEMMVNAGFDGVFIGIESPDKDSLAECNKIQNKDRDLLASVKRIQQAGLDVTGGFIVGFDSDKTSIFKKQIEFIQESRIITAMVGLLNAPKNSGLYRRLKKENRLLKDPTGSNTDFTMNFVPRMDPQILINGYKKVLAGIYSAQPYYQRVMKFLKEKKPQIKRNVPLRPGVIVALIKTIFILGLKDKERQYFWRLFFWSLFKRPKLFPEAITYAVYGFHFRKVCLG